MNKKGFTLVELLATITILVLIGLIIGVNITSILKSTEDMDENAKKEQIEKTACVFASSEVRFDKYGEPDVKYSKDYSNCSTSLGCIITVSDLYKSGMLGEDYSGTDYISKNVKVCYIDDEKICEFNCNENCKCDN